MVGPVTRAPRRCRRRVVDARDHEVRTVPLHHKVPVVQRLPTEVPHVVEPAVGLAEVLVVAGHVGPGESGPDVAERRRLVPAGGDRAVGDVAEVAHDVGIQVVDPCRDPGRPAGAVDRSVVGVGQQDDADAVETRAQPRDCHVADV